MNSEMAYSRRFTNRNDCRCNLQDPGTPNEEVLQNVCSALKIQLDGNLLIFIL